MNRIISTLYCMLIYIEPISLMTTADPQNVTEGNSAVFYCSARGSSIEIIWQYNERNYTMNDPREKILVMNDFSTSDVVSSTLTIQEAMMTGIVTCIVRQSFDGSINDTLSNDNFDNDLQDAYSESFALLISKSHAGPFCSCSRMFPSSYIVDWCRPVASNFCLVQPK